MFKPYLIGTVSMNPSSYTISYQPRSSAVSLKLIDYIISFFIIRFFRTGMKKYYAVDILIYFNMLNGT